jgi:hypothetical protein
VLSALAEKPELFDYEAEDDLVRGLTAGRGAS